MTEEKLNIYPIVTMASLIGVFVGVLIFALLYPSPNKLSSDFEECVYICTKPYYDSIDAEKYCLETCFDNLNCLNDSQQKLTEMR